MLPQDHQSAEEPENKPKNMKNTIIRKLTSMMGISRSNLNEVQESANIEVNPDDKRTTKRHSSFSNNEEKLQKNRESARKARIRKKLYVKLLEQQVSKLKEMAAEGKQIQNDMQSYLNQIKLHVGEKKDLYQLRAVLMNNMQNIVTCSQPTSEENIKSVISSYLGKLGPCSPDRFTSIDKQLMEIEKCFVPRHIQMLFKTDINQLSSDESSRQRMSILLDRLKEEQQKLYKMFNELRQNLQNAKLQLRLLNRVFDQLKSQCSTLEICRLLLFIQSESNKQDIIRQFIRHLKTIDYNRIRQNEEELYDYIFKTQLRRTIFIDLPQSEELFRRVSAFLSK